MITRLNPNWEFKDCTGKIVETVSGGKGTKAKVYVASLMPKIKFSKGVSQRKEKIKTGKQILLNSSNQPHTATSVTHVNYIVAPIANDITMEQANQELYEKYLASLPYPKPIYYIPFTMTLKAGRTVTVSSGNGDLLNIEINV